MDSRARGARVSLASLGDGAAGPADPASTLVSLRFSPFLRLLGGFASSPLGDAPAVRVLSPLSSARFCFTGFRVLLVGAYRLRMDTLLPAGPRVKLRTLATSKHSMRSV